jgi:predicted phosphodiesterase
MERQKRLLGYLITASLLTSCQFSELFSSHHQGQTVYITENFKEQKTCIIGDTGTGTSDQLLVAKALESEGCHNILHTGDIIYPNGIKAIDSQLVISNFMTPYKQTLEQSKVFLSLGNHDYRGETQLWSQIANTNENLYHPAPYYNVIFNEACIFIVDTNLNYRSGQERWLKSQLETLNGNCKVKIAVGHHPYKSSGHHGDAPGMIEKFLKQFVIGKFDIYLAGHDHQLSVEKPVKGTQLLISGAGAKVRPIKNNKATYSISDLGYITLNFKNDDLIFDLKRVDQSGLAHTAFTHSFKISPND